MPMVRYLREKGCGLFSSWGTIVLIAALGIGILQNAPPSFNHNLSGLDARTHTDHHRRQYFDHEDSPSLACSGSVIATVLPFVSQHTTRGPELLVEFLTDGLPYNRPPPIS